eukprot:gnl/TRDRNA2_/TRDRNA2_155007_c0_seq1.p1 gnl/TRDRNA2_/TRDRNA2_155007_c0~~gnl/TRDRNA2_/TRDRNA2_155007_c0_seq1.p1  ORF type:complete len:214 (-),score=25.75 gnl/TRDRNA2_/TRDRNA2_155007_c0_seq1:222-863(-)
MRSTTALEAALLAAFSNLQLCECEFYKHEDSFERTPNFAKHAERGVRRLNSACVGESYCCLQQPENEDIWDAEQGKCLYGQQHVKGPGEGCEAGHCAIAYFPCMCMTQEEARTIEGGRRVGMSIAAAGAAAGVILFSMCACYSKRAQNSGESGLCSRPFCFWLLAFLTVVMIGNVAWMAVVAILADPDGYAHVCGKEQVAKIDLDCVVGKTHK